MDDRDCSYTVRTRIAHKLTAKGWHYETTVELTSNSLDTMDHAGSLKEYLRQADDLARAETRTRNVIDGYNEVAA
jgi:hypothetical protein